MRVLLCLILVALALAGVSIAQNRGGPPQRFHEASEAAPVELIPAEARPPARPEVSIKVDFGDGPGPGKGGKGPPPGGPGGKGGKGPPR